MRDRLLGAALIRLHARGVREARPKTDGEMIVEAALWLVAGYPRMARIFWKARHERGAR